MTSLRFLLQDTYARRMSVFIVVALVLSALVPFGSRILAGDSVLFIIASAALPLLLAFTLMTTPDAAWRAPGEERSSRDRLGAALLLYLSPVLLLNVVYPLVSPTMAGVHIEGVPLTFVVLASSVTVPWLAQAACLPIYRVLGDLMATGNLAEITRRFCQYWPVIFVQSLPLVAVFTLPLWLMTGWSLTVMAHYAALCVLHLLFVQSLVLANVANARGLWALAWSGYAAALFLAPTIWWLPPVVGTLTQIIAMRAGLRHLGVAKRLSVPVLYGDLLRGLLMGSVLWADKYVLFLVTSGAFEVVAVFAAMLPAVIAYNFYFVHLAPRVDRALNTLHSDIATAAMSDLHDSSRKLVRVLDRSVVLTGALAALLTLTISLIFSGLDSANAFLMVSAALATWAFMMLTLLNYELDFIGEKLSPQVIGAVHLVVSVLAFTAVGAFNMTSLHAGSYLLVGAVDLLLIGVAWVLYKHHWSQPEYTLFWRLATTW